MTKDFALVALFVATIVNILLIIYLANTKEKKQLSKIFILTLSLLILWTVSLILQITVSTKLNIKPIYFDYITYIAICFVPVTVFFMGLIFVKTKIVFKKKYLLLLIVPVVSLIVLWTNDFHHLFYKNYSVDFSINEYGPYFNIHNIYSYVLLLIGIIYLLKFSIKNSGFFSKQSILIVIGISIPVITNILGTFQIIPMSIYITPITFTITVIFCAISIFKFRFLGVTPIAMQKIVDRISDSFVVLDESNRIIDFNKTFIKTFNIKDNNLRNINFIDFLKDKKIRRDVIDDIENYIE